MPKNTTVINGNIQDNSALGDLPEWDLRDLYVAEDDPELKKDLDWLRKACSNFSEDYQGKLDKLGALGLLDAVERYQAIEVVAGKIMSFAGLRYYQLTTDSQRTKFMSDMQDKVTKLTTPLVFYGLEFNQISEDRIASLLSENSDLARYKPVFDRMRAMKPYQLSDELEKFLHDQSVVGASAWNRLFDETIASLTFQIKGEELPLEGATNKLSDRNRDMREAAAREIARVLKKKYQSFCSRPQHTSKRQRS
jgi:oligoendopeptidase F